MYSYHLTAWAEPEYNVLVNILKSYKMKVHYLFDKIQENLKKAFIPIYII